MNRRKFLRSIAHSAGLVALSACTLRIENPLLRIEEEGEYRAGTESWDALREYCVKDVEMCERLRAAMPRTVMAIDPGYRTAQEQHSIRGRAGTVTGRHKYGDHNWAPVYVVDGEINSLGQHVERGYFDLDLTAAEARAYAYMQAAKPKPLTGKRQDFSLTGKRQNFYGEED